MSEIKSSFPMNRAAFHEHMRTTFDKCLEISKAKNADYAGSEDPFANFRLVEILGLCDVTTGILVRLSDKITRISNLLAGDGRSPEVKDESIDDTIDDAINYLAILKAWREEERGTPRKEVDKESLHFGLEQHIGTLGDYLPKDTKDHPPCPPAHS